MASFCVLVVFWIFSFCVVVPVFLEILAVYFIGEFWLLLVLVEGRGWEDAGCGFGGVAITFAWELWCRYTLAYQMVKCNYHMKLNYIFGQQSHSLVMTVLAIG